MSSNDVNKSFWLAYCDAIRTQLGDDAGNNAAYFFSTKPQRAPLAGPPNLIDPKYTNQGLYEICDSQLHTDNLFYDPSEKKSFSRTLLKYMDHVDLGGNPSSAQMQKLHAAVMNQDAARHALDDATEKAKARWEKYKSNYSVSDETFSTWSVQNEPQLHAMTANYNMAVNATNMATMHAYGPSAGPYLQDKQHMQAAVDPQSRPGINMPVTALGASDADAILQQITANKAVAPSNADYHVPFYSAANYLEQVMDWLRNRGDTNKSRSEVSFDFDTGNSVDENSFSHTNGGGDHYVPWLSLGVNDDRCEESSMTSYGDQLHTTITMSWDDQFRAIDIQSGRWDIRGSSTYKLKSDAPDEVKGLARVVKFVVVSNLAFEIEFSGDTTTEFHSHVGSGGTIRLFGIPVAVNRDADGESDITHTADWYPDEGKLSVTPKPEAGFASVVALVGEKV
ncbi:hypothetical protein J4E85_001770 [Alternaria conjuncta]|uniref:uncharacterized protein n=1 Tax=Alternaria conjuncta TaxID=181017 RepID=UPI0022207E73|nr:uncharacterized protein J4E85_001770 [Alternaria conjuncta]KAI4936440.1 hypothetical protein J4E85_001770 [Alternaria conjuncta]